MTTSDLGIMKLYIPLPSSFKRTSLPASFVTAIDSTGWFSVERITVSPHLAEDAEAVTESPAASAGSVMVYIWFLAIGKIV